jgi:hypothetical protein
MVWPAALYPVDVVDLLRLMLEVGRTGTIDPPTIGAFNFRLPVEPRKGAFPKLKMPPSDAASQ